MQTATKVLKAMDYARQRGEGHTGLLVGAVLVAAFAIWQIHRGATVQKIGIPDVFEIDLAAKPPQFCMSEDDGYDRFGSDYNGGPKMKNLQQCESSCLLDSKCQALSFHKSSGQCWLKSAPGLRKENSDYVAAVKSRC
jgi:PAN domain